MNESLKRIIIDIKDLQKSPIDNIHYFPNEENIMKGHALIFGPPDTPYEYGNYLFEFNFSEKYPYNPPKVVYKTNDGATRFNPNFYRSGKVCLSILNTWSGDQWSACQTIRSVLLTLQTTMNEMPLLNEPGVDKKLHLNSILNYNKIINFKNIEFTILYYLNNPNKIPIQNTELIERIFENYQKTKGEILESSKKLKNQTPQETLYIQMYDMKFNLNYNLLYDKIKVFINKN
tara:strand:+ start:8347 stop:9042 length:696 start_codon:yes stop_codon:yes gene_type:complete